MPWKGFRFGTASDGRESHLTSPDPPPLRHSEQIPRSTFSVAHLIPRISESTSHSPLAGESQTPEPSPPSRSPAGPGGHTDHTAKQQSTKRNRFSLMRFRHASDPQLSASFNQADSPPVPSLPPPPTIVTTSPTFNNGNASPKRKNKFKPSPEKPVLEHAATDSFDSHKSNPSDASNGGSPRHVPGVSSSPTAPSSLRASHISFEEPGRLSTTSIRSGGAVRGPGDGSVPLGTRLSESSRSDGSSAEHGVYAKNGAASSTGSLFRLPRLKRSRSPLFPLPVKIPPPGNGSRSADSNRPSTGGKKPRPSTENHPEFLPPLPSPSHSSLGFGTPGTASPGTALLRKDSIASAHSAKSASSPKAPVARLARRERSSTLGSLADIRDDPQHSSPDLAPSSRTSTYTGARKSFGDLFGIPHRLKHNADPNMPGDASPIFGAPATPASIASKPNSFSIARDLASWPAKEENDTPATYLSRLEDAVRRSMIATILSQSPEEFYTNTLRRYMRGFSFFGDPIDMAIRKLLMEVELPKETQQIDRVLQSFADRYHECNPGIFASTDQAYFIAFSLLILHTDVFNKNNKRKMQKPDYVRNTQGEGIAEEILECFFENIIYTPFIHVEDELNLSGRLLATKTRKTLFKVTSADSLPSISRDPVDPYALILDGKLGSLRPNLKEVMEMEDIYSAFGPDRTPDMDDLHRAFHKSSVLQIVSARSRPDAFLSHTSIADPAESHPGLVDIRVAKVGLLWRKDPKKKKTRSPWQEWGAVLTGSQLYLFRDVQWVKSLISQYESHGKHGRRHGVTFKPPITDFKPDAIMSTDDAVALVDSSYKKHKHAFLLVRHGGFEEVFLANSEGDMQEWLSMLNYAATFRTTGVRMRGMIGANYEGQRERRRSNRADSTASEISNPNLNDSVTMNRRIDPGLVEEVSVARRELMSQRIREANEKLFIAQKQLDDLLRNARHLQVLTPIHPRARDQVILAAGRMSAKIKWVRLEISRTKCHREMLALDLSGEERLRLEKQTLDRLRIRPTTPNEPAHAKRESMASIAPISPKSEEPHAAPRPATPISPDKQTSSDHTAHPTTPRRRRASAQKSLAPSDISSLQKRPSMAGSKEDSLLSSPADHAGSSLLREPSVKTSVTNSNADESSCAIASSGCSTPTPSVVDDEEERFLREAGILANPSPHTPKQADALNDADKTKLHDSLAEPNSGEHRSKVRRSLQRTLREAHHIPHHHRSKKGRESNATASGGDDGASIAESEGLARGTGSFTLHGKKASVITFGSEWQSMSHEQRLKHRKPGQNEDSRASDMLGTDDGTESIISELVNGKRPTSLRSASTATARSVRNHDAAPAPAEVREARKEQAGEKPHATEPFPNIIDRVVEEETDIEQPKSDPGIPTAHDTTAVEADNDPAERSVNDAAPSDASKQDSPTPQEPESLRSLNISQEKLNRISSPEQAVSA
ncbi:hypothetical protein FQN55_002066 [Onygenales sp. PD_40]|nr:hypothetical protein FQN55_002066 [Onygenales sp. PD_40]KAK2781647.1 hypothetical protein FQN52_001425 [Onygenales sp. PD_12]